MSKEATNGVEAVNGSDDSSNISNYLFMQEKVELLGEIRKIETGLKDGEMSSWFIIQLLLKKLNGMATELKDGIGTYSQNINELSGDENKMAAALKNIEAYEAQHPGTTIPDSDVQAFKKAYTAIQGDLKKLKKFIDGDPTHKPPIPPQPGPNVDPKTGKGDWSRMYDDAQGNFDMISNQQWTNGQTVGQMIASGDDTDLAAAFTEWATQYNQTGRGSQGSTGPFVDWESGAGTAEGLNNLTQDLSSDITNANNKLNQDAQIINSCNSIAQSGVKNATDMYAFLTQHQVSN